MLDITKTYYPGMIINHTPGSSDFRIQNHPLTADQIKGFNTISSLIYLVRPCINSFRLVHLAETEFIRAVEETVNMVQKTTTSTPKYDIFHRQEKIVFAIANYIMLYSAFLDQMRKISSKNVTLDEFNSFLANIYDTCFPHALFEGLRDMLSHREIPITSIDLKWKQGATTNLHIRLEKASIDKCSASLKKMLLNQPDNLNLEPMVSTHFIQMSRVLNSLMPVDILGMIDVVETNYLNHYRMLYGNPPNGELVLFTKNTVRKEDYQDMVHFPELEFRILKETLSISKYGII